MKKTMTLFLTVFAASILFPAVSLSQVNESQAERIPAITPSADFNAHYLTNLSDFELNPKIPGPRAILITPDAKTNPSAQLSIAVLSINAGAPSGPPSIVVDQATSPGVVKSLMETYPGIFKDGSVRKTYPVKANLWVYDRPNLPPDQRFKIADEADGNHYDYAYGYRMLSPASPKQLTPDQVAANSLHPQTGREFYQLVIMHRDQLKVASELAQNAALQVQTLIKIQKTLGLGYVQIPKFTKVDYGPNKNVVSANSELAVNELVIDDDFPAFRNVIHHSASPEIYTKVFHGDDTKAPNEPLFELLHYHADGGLSVLVIPDADQYTEAALHQIVQTNFQEAPKPHRENTDTAYLVNRIRDCQTQAAVASLTVLPGTGGKVATATTFIAANRTSGQ